MESDGGDSDENEHTARSGDSGSDASVGDHTSTTRQEVDDLGQDMVRSSSTASEESEENREGAWDTYRYAPRGLSPVPENVESTEPTDSAASLSTIRPESSASQRLHSSSRIDLERRRRVRTVAAHRRVRSEDIGETPSINTYHASLRGGVDDGQDIDDDGDYRRVVEESTRAYQERMRTAVDESRHLLQGQSEAPEEQQIRQAIEASRYEHDLAQKTQMEADTQHLLVYTAQNHTVSAAENDTDLARVLEQSVQEAKQAAEAEESKILEQTLRLSLRGRPTQTEDDYMDEVARATAASAKEYTDRYKDYWSPAWQEQYDDFGRKGFESSRAGGNHQVVSPPGYNEEETWVRRDVGYRREDSVPIPVVASGSSVSSQTLAPEPSNPVKPSRSTSSATGDSRMPSAQAPPRPNPPAQISDLQVQNAPATITATISATVPPAARPALNRAGPRGPQPLGASRRQNLYGQHPNDAAAAAREAALRRHQTSARAPASTSVADSTNVRPAVRPAPNRAEPQDAQPLGGPARTTSFDRQHADVDAAVAAGEVASRRHQTSARAPGRDSEPRDDTVTGQEFMDWWKSAAKKSWRQAS